MGMMSGCRAEMNEQALLAALLPGDKRNQIALV